MKNKIKYLFVAVVLFAFSVFMVGIVGVNTKVNAEVITVEDFTMAKGASVKLMNNSNESGIRFRFYLSQNLYNELVENEQYKSGIEIGAIIAPKTIADTTSLTYENANVENSQLMYQQLSATNWFLDENNQYTTYVYLYNIPLSKYGTQICAIGVLVNGDNHAYTDMQTRSLSYVAKKANDDDTTLFNQEQKEILSSYYNENSVEFNALYPEWYQEQDDVLTLTAVNKENDCEKFEVTAVKGEQDSYSVTLIDGNYDINVKSNRFVGDDFTNVSINSENHTLSNVNLTTPKLGNETGTTYNATGFVVPANRAITLSNVSASEGFVVRYTVNVTNGGTTWFAGGFGFTMGGKTYGIGVYTRKDSAGSLRIGLHDSDVWQTNYDNGPAFLSTLCSVTAEEIANLNVEIAYYEGNYYVKVQNKYAFKICPELFVNRVSKGNESIYFAGDETTANYADNNNLSQNKDTFFNSSSNNIYKAGTRNLGFKTYQGTSTFTNVQYSLGNQSAIDCIKEMRKVAELMDCQIPSVTPWDAFSDLPDYEWNSQAQEYITNGISYEYDGVNPLNLTEAFGLDTIKAYYEVDEASTQVSNTSAFMPMESGILTIYPNCLGYTNKPIQVQVNATNILVPRNVTFKVAYPNWYGESGDTITAVALNTLSQASENVTVTTQDGDYVVELLKGSYELTIKSARFKDVNVNVTVVNQDQTLANSVQFTTPKLSNESGITYNATGFVIPKNRAITLSNVSSSEGFVVRYTVNVTNSETTWFAGGFGFTMGGKTYGIGVYTRKDTAGSLRIGLHDSTSWRTDNTNGPAFLTTLCSVTAEEIANLNVEIAYYEGNYYVKVQNKYAFRICPELFASQLTESANYAIFFGDNADNGNTNKRTFFSTAGHLTEGKSAIFDNGVRSLGFKTYQGNSTFTNVEYKLGNQYALDAIYGVDGVSGMYGVMLAMKNASAQDFTYTEQTKWPERPVSMLINAMQTALLPNNKQESI